MKALRSRRTLAIGAKYARSDACVPLERMNLRGFELSALRSRPDSSQRMVAWAGVAGGSGDVYDAVRTPGVIKKNLIIINMLRSSWCALQL